MKSFTQGCEELATLGERFRSSTNPERVESIPHIPFVEFDFITPQQLAKFILKRNLAVVFFLSGDVSAHRFDLREANRANPVTILPSELPQVVALGFHP